MNLIMMQIGHANELSHKSTCRQEKVFACAVIIWSSNLHEYQIAHAKCIVHINWAQSKYQRHTSIINKMGRMIEEYIFAYPVLLGGIKII